LAGSCLCHLSAAAQTSVLPTQPAGLFGLIDSEQLTRHALPSIIGLRNIFVGLLIGIFAMRVERIILLSLLIGLFLANLETILIIQASNKMMSPPEMFSRAVLGSAAVLIWSGLFGFIAAGVRNFIRGRVKQGTMKAS
jgi:hypothetical protein